MRLNEGEPEFQALEVVFHGQWLNAKGGVGPLGPGTTVMMPVKGVRIGTATPAHDSRDAVRNPANRSHMKLAA